MTITIPNYSCNAGACRRVIPGSACAKLHWLAVLIVSVLLICSSAVADQRHPELPLLFEQLANAETAEQSSALENQIWQLWLQGPDENSTLLIRQITQAMRVGNLPVALRLCDQLVDSTPGFAEAWNKRATVHYLLGDDESSVSDIRKTIELEPRHFGAISGLGLIFNRRGDTEAALQAFTAVLKLSPASRRAQENVARLRGQLEREI